MCRSVGERHSLFWVLMENRSHEPSGIGFNQVNFSLLQLSLVLGYFPCLTYIAGVWMEVIIWTNIKYLIHD